MSFIEIAFMFGTWLVVTGGVMAYAKSKRTEKSSFYAGATFILFTLFGLLWTNDHFATALACDLPSCKSTKSLVESYIQFILITWGALGGALMAKAIENKH